MREVALLLAAAAALPAPLAAQAVQEGEWEIGSTVTRAELTGGPPDLITALSASRAPARFCLPAEQAARGLEALLKPAPNCTVNTFTTTSGHVAATMSCPAGLSSPARIALSGTVAPDSFAIENHSVLAGGPGQPSGTVDQIATGRRIGPCSP